MMRHPSLRLALATGAAALVLTGCEQDQKRAVSFNPEGEAMQSCLGAAPPRTDGRPSTLAAVMNAAGVFVGVREDVGELTYYYSPTTPHQVTVDRGGQMAPQNLEPGTLEDSRATHLSFCVTRAQTATRPAEIPTDEPLFQPQARPQ